MKKKILFLLFVLISISIKATEPIKIHVTLIDSLATEDQWVYWFSLIGSEYNIEDSCCIAKGQKEFQMQGRFSDNGGFATSWLAFSKKGPTYGKFYPSPGDDLKIKISSESIFLMDIEGSPAISEYIENLKEYFAVAKIIRSIKSKLNTTTDSTEVACLNDSLDYYLKIYYREMHLEVIHTTSYPLCAFDAFINLYAGSINAGATTREELDQHYSLIKQRFPIPAITEFFESHHPPATPRSVASQDRYDQICAGRGHYIPPKQEKQDYSKELSKIPSYQKGNQIDNLILTGLTGENIDLSTIKTQYVLIDFWAGWCGPCRREFPKLKKTHEKYKDILTVYAISLDNNEKEWKKAIEADGTEAFTHVYAGVVTSLDAQKLCKRFAVEAIPANFLLDKDRKIIATNLRGDDLESAMKNLEHISTFEIDLK